MVDACLQFTFYEAEHNFFSQIHPRTLRKSIYYAFYYTYRFLTSSCLHDKLFCPPDGVFCKLLFRERLYSSVNAELPECAQYRRIVYKNYWFAMVRCLSLNSNVNFLSDFEKISYISLELWIVKNCGIKRVTQDNALCGIYARFGKIGQKIVVKLKNFLAILLKCNVNKIKKKNGGDLEKRSQSQKKFLVFLSCSYVILLSSIWQRKSKVRLPHKNRYVPTLKRQH